MEGHCWRREGDDLLLRITVRPKAKREQIVEAARAGKGIRSQVKGRRGRELPLLGSVDGVNRCTETR